MPHQGSNRSTNGGESTMLRRSKPAEEAVRFNLLHEVFEGQADTRPEAVAIIMAGGRVTYAELERRSNRLAHYLQKRGLKKGSLVAILLSRSLEAYVAILATLKAGAAYLPLDPDYPPDRIAYILRDSHAETLLTSATLASQHLSFRGLTILVDTDSDAINSETPARPSDSAAGLGPHDLCYVIYTSGSTGRPKGVQVEHGSVCNLVEAEAEIFHVKPEDGSAKSPPYPSTSPSKKSGLH